jgi:hypothetical protein
MLASTKQMLSDLNAPAAGRSERPSPSGDALRSRRARERRRRGVTSFRIDVSTERFLDALVASRRLIERDVRALRAPQIERELEAVIADFIAR